MNVDVFLLIMRLVLLLVAGAHFVEGTVRREGVRWRLPLLLHMKEMAPTLLSFGMAFAALLLFDAVFWPGSALADLLLMMFVMIVLLRPPENSIGRGGIFVGGTTIGWKSYLGYDSEEAGSGFLLVTVRAKAWKFLIKRTFYAPPKAVRRLEVVGRVERVKREIRRMKD